MRLLVDTHIVLWWLQRSPRLDDDLVGILDSETDVFVSPASAWEVAIKQAAGKLKGPADLPERVRDSGFREIPVRFAHTIAAGRLPMHHRDPFDRLLVAQAVTEGLTLVTADSDIRRYDVPVLP